MVNPQTRGCLEPEVLAAYVDRGLSLAERARVDAHLASCPHCVSMLAGVARTVAELSVQMPAVVESTEATPFVTGRGVAVALAAAAAVFAVVITPSLVKPWLDRDARLVGLVESVGDHRSVLGRLTGGFPHAPLGVPSAGGQDGRAAGNDRVLLTAGKARESFGERLTPSELHALGVSQLLARRYDDAALSLLAASREQPANANYLSDVAAVQLERARLGLRPDDLPRALTAADRAIRLDPSLREAWFNRALALNALSLREQAKHAWTEYLKRDNASAWAAEAKSHLRDASQPTVAETWAAAEKALEQSLDPAAAEAAVKTHVTGARQYLEHMLLPAWSNAVAAGKDGTQELERVRIMADAMLRSGGDALYVDTVNAIDAAARAGTLQSIAAAHQQYAAAWSVYDADQFGRAIPLLRSAKAALESVHSPYALRASSDLASLTYLTSNYAETELALSTAVAQARSHQYPFIESRATWIQGLAAFAQGRLADAQARYEDSLAASSRIGDGEQVAGAHNLLAGLFLYLGDENQTLRHLVEAMKGLEISRSLKLRHALLMIAAVALRDSNPEAALTIQDEAVSNAELWAAPRAIAEATAQRAGILFALGRTTDADADLSTAKRALAATDASARARMEIPISLIEAKLSRATDPQGAVTIVTRLIGLVEGRRERSRLPQLQLELANANILLGRTTEAEGALLRGIQAFDQERAGLSNEGSASARDEAWGLFEAAVRIAIEKHDYSRAFALAERGRMRSLAEARKMAAPQSLDAVQAGLQPDEAVIALNQFEDELAVWLIRRDTVGVTTRKLSRATAERLVASQQDDLIRQSSSMAASQALFNEIVRPIASNLAGVTRLVVVPDTTYDTVSFAALSNPASGRFLVEEMDVHMAPSANTYLAARQRPTTGATDSTPLVFGGGIDKAATSAFAIAAAYPAATVVTGAAATKSRFLQSAPARRAIHFAVPVSDSASNPLLSRVILADEPGLPHSGLMFGSEIARAAMRSRVVVLEEVASDTRSRGEGTLSMARAFMAAGVPVVVGTLPGADEDATRDLMIAFHRAMSSGISAEQALRQVQRNAIQQNGRRLGAWSALVMYGSDR